MTRILIVFLLIACSQCKSPNERFAFQPPYDSVFYYNIIVTDSGGLPDNAIIKRQAIQFTLQRMRLPDSLVHLQMIIQGIYISQPAITMVTSAKGSVSFSPTGKFVTLSTKDSMPGGIDKDFSGYYGTWARVLHQVKGDSLQVAINDRGEVQKVSGFDSIAEKIAGATQIDVRLVKRYLQDYVGDESIRDFLNQLFFYLPGEEIKNGDRWVKNIILSARAPVKQSNLVTVQSIDEDTLHLDVQSVLSAKTSEEGRLYAEGELSGAIIADYNTGMLHTLSLTEQITTRTDKYNVVTKRTIETSRF